MHAAHVDCTFRPPKALRRANIKLGFGDSSEFLVSACVIAIVVAGVRTSEGRPPPVSTLQQGSRTSSGRSRQGAHQEEIGTFFHLPESLGTAERCIGCWICAWLFRNGRSHQGKATRGNRYLSGFLIIPVGTAGRSIG